MMMTAAQILKRLPSHIDYVGFRFRLQFRTLSKTLYIGYFLTEIMCRTPYKVRSFKQGFWTEKRVHHHLDSVGSNFLFVTTLWDDSDDSLTESIERLYKYLIELRLLELPNTEGVENTSFEDVTPFLLNENF